MVLSFYCPILGSRNKDIETFYNRDIIVVFSGYKNGVSLYPPIPIFFILF